MGLVRFTVALLLSLLAVNSQEFGVNPCIPQNAKTNDPFNVGIAYWPGGTVEDWGNVTGPNPCSANLDELEGVQVASFQVKPNDIALLRTSQFAESSLVDGADPEILSVVAFAQGVRSEARYVRSNDPGITGGTGVIENMKIIATFDDGQLQFLRWENSGCIGCGGDRCLMTGFVYEGEETFACATKSFDECRCPDGGPDACPPDPEAPFACSVSFANGATGTDRDSAVFNSGLQLQRIGTLSLNSVFSDVSAGLSEAGETIGIPT